MDSIGYKTILLYFLSFFIKRTLQFNFETRLPLIKNGPPDSYFGFSVAQHSTAERGVRPPFAESLFLVGAPIFSDDNLPFNNTGGVFRCPLTTSFDDCTQIEVEGVGEEEESKDKNGEWLGVTVRSQGPGGKVATCAHRYKQVVRTDGVISSINPIGRCFLLESDLTIEEAYKDGWAPCSGKTGGPDAFGYCQAGTGLAITKKERGDSGADFIIGAPGAGNWQGSMVVTNPKFHLWWSEITQESVRVDLNSYFGFSATSGKFVEDRTTFVVGGAPRADAKGAVVIMKKQEEWGERELVFVDMLVSTSAYSSFGYDVTVADLNGDGYDDIIVGAPMFFDRETQVGGAVYVFINEAYDGTFSGVDPIIITGPLDSRFGMSVTGLGDINWDGFEDFAVGAPYENDAQGAVYVYLGSASDGVVQPWAQKITPSDFPANLHNAMLPNNTFGYSLSGGMDLDWNAFPDLLIGALDSESVVLLRGRPVINMTATVTVSPSQLDRERLDCNVGGEQKLCFTITVCAQYFTASKFDEQLDVIFEVEAEAKRRSLGLNSRVYFEGADPDHILSNQRLSMNYKTDEREACYPPIQAILRDDFSDIYRPIPLRVTFSLPEEEPELPPPGEAIPDMKGTVMFDTTVVTTLATECDEDLDDPTTCIPIPNVKKVEFTKECAEDDGECITDLVVDAEFKDLTEVSKGGNPLMKVGIDNDLKLSVNIENKAEHAYDANLMVEYSNHLEYAGLEEGASERVRFSCGDPVAKEDKNDTMVITCFLGNPYPPVPAKDNMVMRFDANRVPADVMTLSFFIEATMTNEDLSPEDNEKSLIVDVESVTDVQLDGAVTKSQLFFGGVIRGESIISKEEEIGPLMQQRWTVFNQGPAMVDEVKVTIDFPYEVTNGKWLLYMLEAPVVEKGNGSCEIDESYLNVVGIKPCKSNCSEKAIGQKRETYDPVEYSNPDQVDSGSVVVLDCENGTARCFKFTCILRDLTAEQNENEAIILIKARLWNATFMEDYLTAKKVTVRIHGYVEMANNSIITQTNTNNDRDTTNFDVVGPNLYISGGGISWWIILVAVLLGLLLLILLIVILWKFGFFERKTGYKYATVTQKNAETKVGTEKRQMYDEMYNYSPVPGENQPHQL
ncbi:integrin alpha-6-like isoform X3 [Apostichopus japonicus]|uniref:integrin alpha-6-like isoform X3 n=1 Tax=Stichopus japonicus TaxID=307972 RepID=UPI003AB2EBE6